MKNNRLAFVKRYNFVILCIQYILYVCIAFVLFLLFRILFYSDLNTMMHHCEQRRLFFLVTFYINKDEALKSAGQRSSNDTHPTFGTIPFKESHISL